MSNPQAADELVIGSSIHDTSDGGSPIVVIMAENDKFYALDRDHWITCGLWPITLPSSHLKPDAAGEVVENALLGATTFLCNTADWNEDLHDPEMPPGTKTQAFLGFHFIPRTRRFIWVRNNTPCIGSRLLLPMNLRMLNLVQEAALRADESTTTAIGNASYSLDLCKSLADSNELENGFNPADWPVQEITKVIDVSTAMAIAGMKAGRDAESVELPFERPNSAVYHCATGPRPEAFQTGTGIDFQLEPTLFSPGWNTDLESIVLDALLDNLFKGGSENVITILPMRLVCKTWNKHFTATCDSARKEIVAQMHVAHASNLITDWLIVRDQCTKYGVAPWDVLSSRKQHTAKTRPPRHLFTDANRFIRNKLENV